MAGDPTPIGASATLYVYPNTLQDLTLTVKPSENGSILQTLTLSDGTIDNSSYPGALKFSITTISTMGKYTSGIVIAESTGCQTQTANVQAIVVAGTDESITMEPASGYRKLYAWEIYQPNCTPTYFYTDTDMPTSSSKIYNSSGEEIEFSSIKYEPSLAWRCWATGIANCDGTYIELTFDEKYNK